MRIECAKCKELVEVEDFTCGTGPSRIEYRCPGCDEQVTVTSAAVEESTEGEDPEPEPEQKAEPKPEQKAEQRVGRDGGAGPRPAIVAGDVDGSEVLYSLWDRVSEGFAAEGLHDAFIAACEAREALPFAAARYKDWLAEHPGDAVAQARQKQLLALVQVRALLAVAKEKKKDADPLLKATVVGVILLLLVVLLVFAAPLLVRSSSTPDGRPVQKRPAVGPTGPMVQNLKRPRPRAPRRPVMRPGVPAMNPDPR
ncbi:MAG: hypothetical protein ABI333_22100 [bacterium]